MATQGSAGFNTFKTYTLKVSHGSDAGGTMPVISWPVPHKGKAQRWARKFNKQTAGSPTGCKAVVKEEIYTLPDPEAYAKQLMGEHERVESHNQERVQQTARQ